MRDVKSRFWDRNNQKWEVFHIEIEVDPGTKQGDAKLFVVPPDHGLWPDPDFDPETRGEFTGFTDKSGKEIYEGDLVRPPDRNHVFRVFYRGDRFLLERKIVDPTNPGYELANLVDACEGGHCEVVGNIHETTDPLEITKTW